MLQDPNFWRTFAIITAAVGQTAFIMLYFFFPWYESFLGRSLFGKSVALAVIMDFAAMSRIFDFGSNDLAFTIMYLAVAVGVWWQFSSFVRVALADRKDEVSGNANDKARW